MWIQFIVAIFCIVALIVFRDSFADEELVNLRKQMAKLRKQRNSYPENSKEWHVLHLKLKETENQYKKSLGINNLRW